MAKVLLIAPAGGDAEIAGPALRYRQLAEELRRNGIEATLATPGQAVTPTGRSHGRVALARGHTAVICPQGLADEAADLARRLPSECALVIDCYAPALIERALLSPGDARFADFRRLVLTAIDRADLLLVANEAQRAYIGWDACSARSQRVGAARASRSARADGRTTAPTGARRPRDPARALVRRSLAVVRRRHGSPGVRTGRG